ncbi:hypothetical protein C8J57DRAFT_1470875 [Mycena rebaudengoi]|nr:hypothetical protein C8J57DRAFT_1470875 [Mycena rebaudengoi]
MSIWAGRRRAWGRGWWGSRTSTPTPSHRRPCRPRLHLRVPPRPSRAPPRRSQHHESESEGEEEGGEEEGYDVPAYTEHTTEHTPAADFAQPRAHRPMAYLSLPAPDEGDAEMIYVPGSSKTIDYRATPQHTDHHAADTQHSSGDMRAWAAEQARRMPRLRVVPAHPSAHAYRPQQQAQQLQPRYRCVGGGGACGRRLCGWEVVAAEVVGGGAAAADGGTSGWGGSSSSGRPPMQRTTHPTQQHQQQQHSPAHQQQHTQHQQHTPQHTPHQHQRHGAPAPALLARTTTQWRPPRPAYAAAGHGQWTPPRLPRFADLERWSPGVGEVVPSHAPHVPSHVPSHAPQLAPPAPAHTRSLSSPHSRSCRAVPRRVCERGPAGGEGRARPPMGGLLRRFNGLLAGYPAVPPFHRPPVPPTPTPTPTCID